MELLFSLPQTNGYLVLKSTIVQSLGINARKLHLGYIKDMQKPIKLFIFCLLLVATISDTAIVTYHLYTKYDKLTTVACSDGGYGLMGWGYTDLSYMFPYVTAWQSARWNSPNCGNCAKIMWNGKYTYVTVIDMCGVINTAYSHFDMSKQAFYGLFGDLGIAKGTMTANFTMVSSKYCPGNRKGVMSAAPVNYQNTYQQANVRSENDGQSPFWKKNKSPTFNSQKSQDGGSSSQKVQSSQNQQSTQQTQNPLWVKLQSATSQKLKPEAPQDSSSQKVQSSGGVQNPLWVNESPENLGPSVSSQDLSLIRTQYGGFSYDKQNAINEGRDDNF